MLSAFIERQMRRASYKQLEDGTFYGEIPGMAGVWADYETLEGCRDTLREVFEAWIVLKLKHQEPIPDFDIAADAQEDKAYA